MTDNAIDRDRELIAYRRLAGNDPVLLVHGFGSDAEDTWGATGWVQAFADAGRGVVAVDLRGHGASSRPHDESAYRPSAMAADLLAVLDEEGLGAVDVMGYSMGSQVCRGLARDAPGRIHRLVLGGIGRTEQLRAWGAEAVRGVLLERSPAPDAAAAEILGSVVRTPGADREALAACAAGMASEELPIGPLPMPALLVAGDADPVSQDAAELAHEFGARFVAVAKRNHVTTLSSRAFKAAVFAFLSPAG
jgi:non-heme chloroperoxidase